MGSAVELSAPIPEQDPLIWFSIFKMNKPHEFNKRYYLAHCLITNKIVENLSNISPTTTNKFATKMIFIKTYI